jgi:hypothetical protein
MGALYVPYDSIDTALGGFTSTRAPREQFLRVAIFVVGADLAHAAYPGAATFISW